MPINKTDQRKEATVPKIVHIYTRYDRPAYRKVHTRDSTSHLVSLWSITDAVVMNDRTGCVLSLQASSSSPHESFHRVDVSTFLPAKNDGLRAQDVRDEQHETPAWLYDTTENGDVGRCVARRRKMARGARCHGITHRARCAISRKRRTRKWWTKLHGAKMQDIKTQDIVTGHVLHICFKYKVYLINHFRIHFKITFYEI